MQDPDGFYAALSSLLEREDVDAIGMLIRLTLILANEVGDAAVLAAALEEASQG